MLPIAQPLWPEHHLSNPYPPSPQHHHNHRRRITVLLPVPPPMGGEEQTLSQIHHSPPSSSSSSSSSQDPNPTTTATKIPFRPRKVRKLSSEPDSNIAPRVALRFLPRPLTADGEIAAALAHLRAADPHLALAIDHHGLPLFPTPQPPFHALVRSILYQQLAFKAAASIYARFLSLCGGDSAVLPHVVLSLAPHNLRQIGVSARKASYLHDLASKYQTGILSDSSIVAMDDKSLFSMLTMVKGIGAWSVHMFMIFSLHRPDVLPVGDLGVRKGVRILYDLDDVPRPSQMEKLCQCWSPYRSVGAWYMWRLVEAKGSSVAASAVAGAMQYGQMQPELIDPLQLLPNMV